MINKIDLYEQKIKDHIEAIEDIKRRKKIETHRKHPPEHYIQQMQFELEGFKATLKRLKKKFVHGTPNKPGEDLFDNKVKFKLIKTEIEDELA